MTESVFVMEVTVNNEYGYTSVHSSYAGALAALEAKVDELDVRDEYELSEPQTYDQTNGSVLCGDYGSSDFEPLELSYGISCLEVRP